MVDLDRLQCPGCGATLTAEGRDTLFCSYCGAKLKVKTGASGNPMAVLDGIKDDTSLMAKKVAMQHLEEELISLKKQQEALQQRKETLEKAESENGCLFVMAVLGLMAALPLLGTGLQTCALGQRRNLS